MQMSLNLNHQGAGWDPDENELQTSGYWHEALIFEIYSDRSTSMGSTCAALRRGR